MTLKERILKLLKEARVATRELTQVSSNKRDKAIMLIAEALVKNSRYLLLNNAKDIALAENKGLSGALIDRLRLTDKRIREMAESLRSIASLKDPIGEVIKQWKRPNGLVIKKVRVPIGVIAIIYEARPNVTSDCAGLCIKSGNACILRGGSEAINSNLAIHHLIAEQLDRLGIPRSVVTIIDTADRRAVKVLLESVGLLDLVIPRGGEGLIRYVTENSLIPVIKHYKGVCNLYVDKYADLKMALDVTINAKVQRPGVCNAIENLLVHRDVADRFLPEVGEALRNFSVELRGCEKTRRILKGIKRATEKDWYTEYLDLILSIKIVDSVDEAIEFITRYGSAHSDAIITKNKKVAERFLDRVDSACVYLNASTRFTDGYEFGLGAEIGISTDKIHARGPMALEELCTYKYKIYGSGQIRE